MTKEAPKIEKYKGVWVFAEERDGGLLPVALELLSKGREIADKLKVELAAILFGYNIRHLVPELGAYGADKVYLADDPILTNYRGEPYASLMQNLIEQYKPEIVLIGASSFGLDLAPRVAVKVNTGLSAHCCGLDINQKGQLVAQVPGFGGSIMASIICPDHRPQMATVRPGFFQPQRKAGHAPSVIEVKVNLREEEIATKVIKVFPQPPKSPPIESAEIIVAGGYGVGSKEKWQMIEELAKVLGGRVGATRPPCDEGWAGEEQMIGQSGKTIRPKLYVGIGISGAMHHVVGIKDSKVIVAINKDPKAPIFQACDFGIVASFDEITPHLIKEFARAAEEKRK